MKRQLLLFFYVCLLMPALLTSCSTVKHVPQQAAGAKSDDNSPRFINNVYVKGNYKGIPARGSAELKNSATAVTSVNTIQEPATTSTAETPKAKPKELHPIVFDTPAPVLPAPPAKAEVVTTPSTVAKPATPDTVEDNHITTGEILPEDEVDPLIVKYAEMIRADPKKLSNYPLYHFVDDWYGTGYKWGGDDQDGIDCSGFSKKLYEDIYGVDLLRTVKQQKKECEKIRRAEEVRQGDLVFFRIRRIRVSHVGVYLANGYFVHASSSHGVVISSVNDRYWHRRFAGYGRMDKDDNTVSESGY